MKKQFTIELLKSIKNLYLNQNLSATSISKIFGTTPNTIISRLREMGIEVINKQNALNFDLEKDIIPAYQAGTSLSKLAKQFHTSIPTLSKKLKEVGIEIVNRQNETKFNEQVFDVLDTEEKVYWLGFMFADGYLSSRDNLIELSLKGSDVDHLYKFHKFLQHNKDIVKVSEVKCGESIYLRCRLGVTNKHLWTTLNNYGCTPLKSLTLHFPDLAIFQEKSLIIPFIRGYFDGDGCATISNDLLYISFIGCENFLLRLKEILNDYNIETGKLSKDIRSNAITMHILRRDVVNFCELIYKNSTIHLDRKYDKCMNFCRLRE